MGFFDSEETIDNPLIASSDLHDTASGWYEDPMSFLKGSTYSAWWSLKNTGTQIGNWFRSPDNQEELIDFSKEMHKMDDNLGNYYDEHSTAVNMGAFLGTTLVTGFGVSAGARMLAATRLGEIGSSAAEALGILPTANRGSNIANIALDLADKGTQFKLTNPAYLKTLMGDVAGDYAQGVATMSIAEAAMNTNPMFDDMSMGDMVKMALMPPIVDGSLGTVLVGGSTILRGSKLYGMFKDAKIAVDQKLNPFAKSTELGKSSLVSSADQLKAYALDNAQMPSLVGLTDDEIKIATRKYDDAVRQRDISARKVALDITKGDAQAANKLWQDIRKMSPEDLEANLSGLTGFRSVAEHGIHTAKGTVDVTSGAKIPDAHVLTFNKGEGTLIVNRNTGDAVDSFLPTIGDNLKSGDKLTIKDKGIVAGKLKVAFPTAASTELDVTSSKMNYLQAEARHILGAESDKPLVTPLSDVGSLDIPALDSIYLKGDASYYPLSLNPRSGSMAIGSPEELGAYILDTKQQAVNAAKMQGMGTEEIMARLNVSKEFVEGNIPELAINNALSPEIGKHVFAMQNSIEKLPTGEVIKPYLEPRHYVTTYEKPRSDYLDYQNNPNVRSIAAARMDLEAKLQAHDELITGISDTITNGKMTEGVLPSVSEMMKLVDTAASQSAGASALAFANAPYLKNMGAFTEAIGKWVNDTIQRARQDVTSYLEPYAAKLLNGDIAAKTDFERKQALVEFNILDAKARRMASRLMYLNTDETSGFVKLIDSAAYKYAIGTVSKQLTHLLKGDENALAAALEQLKGKPADVLDNIKAMNLPDADKLLKPLLETAHEVKSRVASDFVKQHIDINSTRMQGTNRLREALGSRSGSADGLFYPPPMDTSKLKHFALVKDNRINGGGHGMVYGDSPESLSQQIRAIQAEFGDSVLVFTNKEAKEFKQALGEYDYEKSINSAVFDDALTARGRSGAFIPPSDGDWMLQHYVGWHANQESRLIRDMVDAKYSSVFHQLESIGSKDISIASSKFTGMAQGLLEKATDNPMLDYRRTALNIPKASNQVLSSLNTWLTSNTDSVWNRLKYAVAATKTGKGRGEELEALSKQFQDAGVNTKFVQGMTDIYTNSGVSANVLQRGLQRMHGVLTGLMLGSDPFNAVTNTVGSSILALPETRSLITALKSDARFADVVDSIHVKVPDSPMSILSVSKMIATSMKNFWADDGTLMKRYQKMGFDTTELEQMKSAVGDMAFSTSVKEGEMFAGIEKAAVKVRKWTGNTLAEQHNRFYSANIADMLTEPLVKAGRMSPAEQKAIINTFVNRTQGNFVAAQRPQIFQGLTGSAISLYQTYFWNMMQQVTRYIADGEGKNAALAMMMQASIFGASTLPGFHNLNNAIGNMNGNVDHKDFYSAMGSGVSKTANEWLMYGLGSNALGLLSDDLKVNLYTRGDLTPRNALILPTSLSEIPAFSMSAKVISEMGQMISKSAQGAAIMPTILQGIEHMNINRPLTGFSQLLQGKATTGQGDMLSPVDAHSLSALTRIAGARPLSEAYLNDAIFRSKQYQAYDIQRRKDLGEIIASYGDNPEAVTEEQFANALHKYTISGGHQKNFIKFYTKNLHDAQAGAVARVMEHANTNTARYLQSVMGGVLPDQNGQALLDFNFEDGDGGAVTPNQD